MILLVAKSGVGKDYLIKSFNLKCVVSHTTRSPRPGEKKGIDKHFHKDFLNEDCIAYTYFNGNHYWATSSDLIGKDVYVIDVNGIIDLYKRVTGYNYNTGKIDLGDLSNIDSLFYQQFKIVYLTCAWWKRMYRLVKRDGWRKGLKRFFHDIKAFRDIKKFNYREVRL
jgi:guanylate kinase